mmetsp:Transcript_9236/g.20620  ORF Transcript_9236/g.20620 Transcript_9236/m.20620 type:complete len:526 (-) Transcript_9236:195-1772(-)
MLQASVGRRGLSVDVPLLVILLANFCTGGTAQAVSAEIEPDGHARLEHLSRSLPRHRLQLESTEEQALRRGISLQQKDEEWAELLHTDGIIASADEGIRSTGHHVHSNGYMHPRVTVHGDVAVSRIQPPPRGFPKKDQAETPGRMAEDHTNQDSSSTADSGEGSESAGRQEEADDRSDSEEEATSSRQRTASAKHVPRIGEHVIGSPDYVAHPKVLKFPTMQHQHHHSGAASSAAHDSRNKALHDLRHTQHHHNHHLSQWPERHSRAAGAAPLQEDHQLNPQKQHIAESSRRGPAMVRSVSEGREPRRGGSDPGDSYLAREEKMLNAELALVQRIKQQDGDAQGVDASKDSMEAHMTPAQRNKIFEESNKHRADPTDPKAPVDCRWLAWQEWSPCSRSCADELQGPGQRWRVRDMTKELHGGLSCWQLGQGGNSEHQICATFPCPSTTESTTTTTTTTVTTTTTTTSTTTTVTTTSSSTSSEIVSQDTPSLSKGSMKGSARNLASPGWAVTSSAILSLSWLHSRL